ncbi:MmcQ/YjbR family DNA-binding protein [Flavobacterium sp. TP390]|uniref:MmcQ/YjbR family DNA-binding protein n=1 Tax=Flavobacterium profundi TaxID=1774945 RepID=A0A6I4ITY1_9FLAO|nr:MmcQ/YjbR family DNA-binding protein [Flavobacterium profundi]MVO10341.1 MmcQ/YjbR family DNA-binding protein [Flavobacterium profundi]
MITIEGLRKYVFSFPEVEEAPHFEKISFRVQKKIFVTYSHSNHTITLKLSLEEQDVFSSGKDNAIFPVPNEWGKQGWTVVDLSSVHEDLFHDAITTAYCTIAPKKLVQLVQKKLA